MNQPHYHVCTMRLNAAGAVPGTVKRLNPDGYFIQPMLNRRGDQVLFWGHEPEETGFNIWRYDFAGDALKKLTDDRAVTGHPFWSANGQRIVFFSTIGCSEQTDWRMDNEFATDRSPRNLWIMDREGQHRQQLTSGAVVDERPCLSPDGQTVVFVSNRSGALNLWRLELTGGEPKPVTNHAGLDYRPVFSPNGDRLAFFSTNNPSGIQDLCVMDWPNGPRRFPVPPGHFKWIHGPFWLPDGDTLLLHVIALDPAKRSGLWQFALSTRRLEPLILPGINDNAHGSTDAHRTRLALDTTDPLPWSARSR